MIVYILRQVFKINFYSKFCGGRGVFYGFIAIKFNKIFKHARKIHNVYSHIPDLRCENNIYLSTLLRLVIILFFVK